MPGSFGTITPHLALTPDASRVVYRADARVANLPELWSVPLTGGPAQLLHNPLSTREGIGADFHLLRNSRDLLFRGRPNESLLPLWRARVDQTGPFRLRSGPFLPHPTEVLEFQVTAQERHVVFLADQEADGTYELFSFPLRPERRAPRPVIR